MTFISTLILFIKGSLFIIIVYFPHKCNKSPHRFNINLFYSYIFRKKSISKIIQLDGYKIQYPIITCMTIVFVVYIILVNLFIFKVLNIGNVVDLKELYKYIIDLKN